MSVREMPSKFWGTSLLASLIMLCGITKAHAAADISVSLHCKGEISFNTSFETSYDNGIAMFSTFPVRKDGKTQLQNEVEVDVNQGQTLEEAVMVPSEEDIFTVIQMGFHQKGRVSQKTGFIFEVDTKSKKRRAISKCEYGIVTQNPEPTKSKQNEVVNGALAAPILTKKNHFWDYRTRIRDGARLNGVNFADKFTVVTWGCGSDCEAGAIIDRSNGQVLALPGAVYGYDINAQSVVLIVNPDLSEYHKSALTDDAPMPDWLYRDVYVMKNDCLLHVIHDKQESGSMTDGQISDAFANNTSIAVDPKSLSSPICE